MKILHKIILFAILNFLITISLVFAFKDTNIVTTPQPVQNITPTSTPNNVVDNTPNSSRCIITIDGQKYDVTEFLKIHSGGDVFKCGADMTADYQSRHGTNVSIMQRYLIIGGSSTIQPSSVSNTNQTAAPVRRNNNDD